MPVIPAEPVVFASSRTTPTNERCSRYDMRERFLNAQDHHRNQNVKTGEK